MIGEIAIDRHLVALVYLGLGMEYCFAWVQELSLVVTGLWFGLVGSVYAMFFEWGREGVAGGCFYAVYGSS